MPKKPPAQTLLEILSKNPPATILAFNVEIHGWDISKRNPAQCIGFRSFHLQPRGSFEEEIKVGGDDRQSCSSIRKAN
jgi:hypothetical protein